MNDSTYTEYLLSLMNNVTIDELSHSLKLNIYLTLLALSNSYYSEEKYQEALSKVEDFLRKTNNLKVKIQLKRRDSEIEELIGSLKEMYNNNAELINKYNYDKLDIMDIIGRKDAAEITGLIDKLTREKNNSYDNKDMFDNLRMKIIGRIFNSKYYIMDNTTLCIKGEEEVVVSLDMFYRIFDYLLNIDNYPQPLLNTAANRMHTVMIADVIKVLNERRIEDIKVLIPIVLTNIMNQDIANIDEMDFSHFNIDNIKITDLYALAENNQNINGDKSAKWRKIIIPNRYLYERIKEISSEGTYYFKDDILYLEKVNKSISDFKISISNDNMITFLKTYLQFLKAETTYTR